MSLKDMEENMEAGLLAELPKDGGALAALERLETPPPTPIFLSELESSPLSSAGLASPLADSELEPSGGDQDMMTMDDLLNSCGVSCTSSVDSPLLSSLDLMWGASASQAPASAPVASAPSPAPVPAAPEPTPAVAARPSEEAPARERPAPPTPEQQLQAEVQRLHRQQQQEEHNKQLLEKQVRQLQKLQQRQDQQHQLLLRQQKQAQRQQQRQKQHLHWQQQQLQQRQAKQNQQQQQQRSHQYQQQRENNGAKTSSSQAASVTAAGLRGPTKVRRKTRVITIPSSVGTTTVTVPHIVICTPSVINSRPAATSIPVTFSVQDRQTAGARVAARPTVTFGPRDPNRPLGVGVGVGVRRRVVGRAAPGAASTLVKRHSVESAPSSPETAPCSLLRIQSRQKPVTKVTTATQTGEPVDEVLRNNDSTLIRLLVTGQDLTNGYRLCPDGQCLTPERQPAPPSLFAGLPDRGSSVLLSMLSNDDEPQLPALFPSETAGRLLDEPL